MYGHQGRSFQQNLKLTLKKHIFFVVLNSLSFAMIRSATLFEDVKFTVLCHTQFRKIFAQTSVSNKNHEQIEKQPMAGFNYNFEQIIKIFSNSFWFNKMPETSAEPTILQLPVGFPEIELLRQIPSCLIDCFKNIASKTRYALRTTVVNASRFQQK